ncbi:Penicillin-binding protein activator LpoA [Dickeya dianthicola]|uniref:Penicillin-binding protein activator LpoA n=3 Tax=Dickeya dianthicola TaxID=204039 RepID=A0AAP2CWB4_9GAMM|nr:penicillin-binding protein activator [Dickeya dianthicola]ATO31251.1 LppC putative lipoprotein [Dickeya dianthicola RNS04.9]AYC17249.1 Penicillin-binding protein activator LpoA [Dickeya dianthicola]MBI0436290.1 penicillin-binding protein activator [Dickeya dianthicola]MBI0448417.1 penicillin-binding protein activator [Dickeya dianthicola]MBI0452303.1 penicillin-binding protein activator [Dickeya dianthicola]
MLPLNSVRTHAGRLIPVMLAALFLAGCPSQAPQGTAPQQHVEGKAGASSDYYLQQMQQSGDDSKADWQLLAIHALIQEGKLPQANGQLNALSPQLNDKQRQEQRLLLAELAVAQNDLNAANSTLAQLDVKSLSPQQQERYYQTQIKAAQNRPSLTMIRAYIGLEPLLQGDAHQRNIDQTWAALTRLTQQDLGAMVINVDENTLQGWLDLLNLWQTKAQVPTDLQAAIEDWKKRYPRHPAAKQLPSQLGGTPPVAATQPGENAPVGGNAIALLLPLNGQAQTFANAIQQGFSAAKSGQVSLAMPAQTAQSASSAATTASPAAPATPTPDISSASSAAPTASPTPLAAATAVPALTTTAASTIPVKVYDTSNQTLANVIAQAQKDGATTIVGPLLKNEVEQLPRLNPSLNVLALNQPEQVQPNPNICYFALSPEDEAADAAEFIHKQGKQHPLILAPRGNLGDRVVAAFAKSWQQQSGGVVLQQRTGGVYDLKQAINSGAGLALNGQPVITATSAPSSSTTVGGLTIPNQAPPIANVTSDGNVDAVYIIATPDELTLIKPMIDMRNKGALHPALYASSRSYQAGLGPDFRFEMEGLQFSDIPLLTGASPALMQQVSTQFRNDYSLVRLFAMGMDAWKLASNFAQLHQPGNSLSGATGVLSTSPDCVVNRKLTWLQFRQGQLVPAS